MWHFVQVGNSPIRTSKTLKGKKSQLCKILCIYITFQKSNETFYILYSILFKGITKIATFFFFLKRCSTKRKILKMISDGVGLLAGQMDSTI